MPYLYSREDDDTEENPLDPAHAVWLGCKWQVDVEHCRTVLNDPVDWIIIDHYALDYRWENAMRDKCQKMMCIDDLADRVHECDLLLDQNLGRIEEEDYVRACFFWDSIAVGASICTFTT